MRENSIRQIEVKGSKQRIAKELVTEAASAARKLKEVGKLGRVEETREPASTVRDLKGEEKRGSQKGLEKARGTGEPTAAARDPEGEEKQEN